jgi:hypothetical protein
MTPDKAKSLSNDIRCAITTLSAIADELDTAYPDSDFSDKFDPAEWIEITPQEPTKPESPKAKSITLEQVRAVLSEKSANGKRTEVKALLTKYGVTKLSDISSDNFAAVLKEAESL